MQANARRHNLRAFCSCARRCPRETLDQSTPDAMGATPVTTATPVPPAGMFDALSITQTRNLMRRIGKAIQDTSQVCKILRTVAAGIRPDLDARHGDLHRDLCQLHSDLFDALMTKYAEADATLGAALALTRQS